MNMKAMALLILLVLTFASLITMAIASFSIPVQSFARVLLTAGSDVVDPNGGVEIDNPVAPC